MRQGDFAWVLRKDFLQGAFGLPAEPTPEIGELDDGDDGVRRPPQEGLVIADVHLRGRRHA